jgi:hypothetical protein
MAAEAGRFKVYAYDLPLDSFAEYAGIESRNFIFE